MAEIPSGLSIQILTDSRFSCWNEEIRTQGEKATDKTEIWREGVTPQIWNIILSKKYIITQASKNPYQNEDSTYFQIFLIMEYGHENMYLCSGFEVLLTFGLFKSQL
jgi:hypothetical protein